MKFASKLVLGCALLGWSLLPGQESEHGSSKAQPLRVSSGVMAGRKVYGPPPIFRDANGKYISGTVAAYALIDVDGRVTELRILLGPEMLRQPFLEAVRQWRYRPFEVNGVVVPVETTITMNIDF